VLDRGLSMLVFIELTSPDAASPSSRHPAITTFIVVLFVYVRSPRTGKLVSCGRRLSHVEPGAAGVLLR